MFRRDAREQHLNRFFFFFFTLVTGPRRSLDLKLSDTRVYGPQIRARLGITALLCKVVVAHTDHTMDNGPFIKSQLASTQSTLGPCVEQIWPRYPQNLVARNFRAHRVVWSRPPSYFREIQFMLTTDLREISFMLTTDLREI